MEVIVCVGVCYCVGEAALIAALKYVCGGKGECMWV